MEKSQIANKYELVFIVDALLSSDQKEIICKEVADIINKLGGKVINNQVWLDKQKFTYEIKKKREGTYYLTKFEMNGPLVSKVRQTLRIKDNVLRFEVIKLEK